MKIKAVGAISALLMLAAGCSSIQRIDAQTFLEHAKSTSLIGSASSYDFIGISHDRAYIQYDTTITLFGGSATYVYWTPLAELPTNVVLHLKSGTTPWPQWWKLEEERNANKPPEDIRR